MKKHNQINYYLGGPIWYLLGVKSKKLNFSDEVYRILNSMTFNLTFNNQELLMRNSIRELNHEEA